MALTTRRDADLLQRILDDEPALAASPEVASLARVAGELRAIPRQTVRPDPAFVALLRADLVAQAEAQADARADARADTDTDTDTRADTSARPRPRALVVRLPRGLVPGIIAGVLGLAVLVGGLSTQALPGDRLYDVKLGIGAAQVRLAGSDLARGRALLNQVDKRLDEVDRLVAAGDPRSQRVDLALSAATSDLTDAQRLLLSTSGGQANPAALRALADASAQAQGRLRALEPRLPTASGPSVQRLLDLLTAGDAALAQQLLACGAPCADLRRDLSDLIDRARAAGATAGSPSGSTSPAATRLTGRPGVSVPVTVPTGAAGGAAGDAAGGAAGASGPKAGLPGVTASLPGVGVTVPGVSLTTSSGASSSSVTVPPIAVTLGPVTASVSTSGCIIGLGGLCIGG